jgi:hypothetical protein
LEIVSKLILFEIAKNEIGVIGTLKYGSHLPTLYSNLTPAIDFWHAIGEKNPKFRKKYSSLSIEKSTPDT